MRMLAIRLMYVNMYQCALDNGHCRPCVPLIIASNEILRMSMSLIIDNQWMEWYGIRIEHPPLELGF